MLHFKVLFIFTICFVVYFSFSAIWWFRLLINRTIIFTLMDIADYININEMEGNLLLHYVKGGN